MGDLAGRVAIVAGGGRGIGRAICTALAGEGVQPVVNYRSSREPAASLAGEITAAGGSVELVGVGVEEEHAPELIVNAALERYGRLDILVNNAGINRWPRRVDPEAHA